jgi:hypothetical protein
MYSRHLELQLTVHTSHLMEGAVDWKSALEIDTSHAVPYGLINYSRIVEVRKPTENKGWSSHSYQEGRRQCSSCGDGNLAFLWTL